MTEIWRSRDGRWAIERAVDRYLVYDEFRADDDQGVWSCSTLPDLYDWLNRNNLNLADFDEVA